MSKIFYSLFLCLLVLATSSRANDDVAFTRPSLKGLKHLYVNVTRASTDNDYGFLSDDDIKTAVESKLRIAGIQLADDKDAAHVLEHEGAFLSVSLTVIRAEYGSIYAFHIGIEVDQTTRLLRNQTIVVPLSATWSRGTTGILTKDRLRSIRDNMNDLIDIFVNAYLSVNPKMP
jgi:hypothetical protein